MYNKLLDDAIRKRLSCSEKVSRQMVEIFLEELRRLLLRGEKVILPSIGTLQTYRKKGVGRVKKTARVRFTISRKLLDDLTEKYGKYQFFDVETEQYHKYDKFYRMIYDD